MTTAPTPRFERIGMTFAAALVMSLFAWAWSVAGLLGAVLTTPFLLLFLSPAIGMACALLAALVELALWLIAVIRRQRARAA